MTYYVVFSLLSQNIKIYLDLPRVGFKCFRKYLSSIVPEPNPGFNILCGLCVDLNLVESCCGETEGIKGEKISPIFSCIFLMHY